MKACFAQFPVSYIALFYISTNITHIPPYTQFSTLDNFTTDITASIASMQIYLTDFSEDKS